MCNLRADVAAICRNHDYAPDFLDREIAALSSFRSDGIVSIEGRKVTVNESGRPFVRSVCAAFDAYFGADS